MDKTRLAVKRYGDKWKKVEREFTLKTKKHKKTKSIKKQIIKLGEDYKKYDYQLQKQRRKQVIYEKKEYVWNRKRALIRKQNEFKWRNRTKWN